MRDWKGSRREKSKIKYQKSKRQMKNQKVRFAAKAHGVSLGPASSVG